MVSSPPTPPEAAESSSARAQEADMAPSTLDLLMLTFNCAKNLINVAVFANHLRAALSQNATGLPDLVVLSLQEVAPMGYSFVGGYFFNPYITQFEEALNLAAVQYDDDRRDVVSVTPTADQPKKPYGLVKAGNVGYTGIAMFARDPERVKNLQEAQVGFGYAEMGNKGAVGLRCLYEGKGGEETEMTFVATHLAAMEWNLPRRNANWAAIMRGLTFDNPEEVLKRHRVAAEEQGNGGEQERLLDDDGNDEAHLRLQRQIHDISVFKPTAHLFVAGDLNYRISTTSPPPAATFPNLDPESEHYYMNFFHRDQLTREREANKTMHGLSEAKVTFPPTYKYVIKGSKNDPEPKWSFAPHRYPGWTDRVLYLDTPRGADSKIQVHAYDAMPVVASSDHRPVFLRATVPLISPAEMEQHLSGHDAAAAADEDSSDPRVRLPAEIDPEAWERRRAARTRELVAGWSMMLWSTKEGALVLGTVLAVGLGWYWLSLGGR